MTLQGAPSISHRGAALAVLAAIALHLALIALLNESAAWQPRRAAQPASPRVTLRLIPLPVPPAPVPRVEAAAPRPNAPPKARMRIQTPDRVGSAPDAAPVSAAAINATRPDAVSRAEPAASAPEPLASSMPSLMDTEATRRAIRASARQPSLTDQLARARDEPRRASVDERLGAAVRGAAKGDCMKGEFPGAGMGLLSLPFLAAALSSGNCAK